jgi:four helix bundle protein
MFYKDPLSQKSYKLAIESINLYKQLVAEQKEYVLSRQLLRSGTAVGALIREAKNAESPKDFIHKLHIAQKECDEVLYWIELLNHADYLKTNQQNLLEQLATELLKMLKSSILTLKQKHNKN